MPIDELFNVAHVAPMGARFLCVVLEVTQGHTVFQLPSTSFHLLLYAHIIVPLHPARLNPLLACFAEKVEAPDEHTTQILKVHRSGACMVWGYC
jgi:hypothetical protein